MYEIILALSVVLFAAILTLYLRHPAASMFHPMTFFLMFHGLVFTIRPVFGWIYDYHSVYDNFRFQPTEWDRVVALLCTDLTLVTFSYVAMTLAREPLPLRDPQEPPSYRAQLLRAFAVVAVPIGLIGIYGLFNNLELRSSMDISQIRALDSRTGAGHLIGVNGYVLSLPILLIPLVAIIPYLGRFRWWSYLPFAAFALMKLATGGRGQVFSAAVMIVLLHMLDHRRKWPSLKLVPVVIAGVLVFNAIGEDRGLAIRAAMGVEDATPYIRRKAEQKPLETMDIANMEFLELVVWAVPQRTGTYEYFVHNLQIFTEPIPRSLWPGKPVGPPILMFELYRYAVPLGATYSIAGSGWMAAGYVGVILWTIPFAAFYAWLYRTYIRGSRSAVATVTFVVLISTSPIIYRDGSIISLAKSLQFYVIPVAALALTALYLANSGAGRFVRAPGPIAQGARARRRERATAGAPGDDGMTQAATDTSSPRARRRARLSGHS